MTSSQARAYRGMRLWAQTPNPTLDAECQAGRHWVPFFSLWYHSAGNLTPASQSQCVNFRTTFQGIFPMGENYFHILSMALISTQTNLISGLKWNVLSLFPAVMQSRMRIFYTLKIQFRKKNRDSDTTT